MARARGRVVHAGGAYLADYDGVGLRWINIGRDAMGRVPTLDRAGWWRIGRDHRRAGKKPAYVGERQREAVKETFVHEIDIRRSVGARRNHLCGLPGYFDRGVD